MRKHITIQHRRGTTDEWNSANPVLAFGEVGVESSTFGIRHKVGDGESPWLALPYVGAGGSPHSHDSIENLLGRLTLDSAGGVQHFVDGVRKWWVDSTGTLVQGNVPISQVTGLPGAPVNSGLRNVSALFGITSGAVFLHVTNGWVWLLFQNAIITESGTVTLTATGLSTVCPQAPLASAEGNLGAGTPPSLRRLEANRYGQVRIIGATAGDVVNGSMSWPMTRPAPSAWPGVATS